MTRTLEEKLDPDPAVKKGSGSNPGKTTRIQIRSNKFDLDFSLSIFWSVKTEGKVRFSRDFGSECLDLNPDPSSSTGSGSATRVKRKLCKLDSTLLRHLHSGSRIRNFDLAYFYQHCIYNLDILSRHYFSCFLSSCLSVLFDLSIYLT